MTKASRVENRIDACQRRLEYYRAHNIYGIVNGQPGWIYEAEIEFFEDQLETLEQELEEAQTEDALEELDYEMGQYEQTKFEKKVKRNIPVLILWIPATLALAYAAREYAINIVAVSCLILIARDAWFKIRVSKRH